MKKEAFFKELKFFKSPVLLINTGYADGMYEQWLEVWIVENETTIGKHLIDTIREQEPTFKETAEKKLRQYNKWFNEYLGTTEELF